MRKLTCFVLLIAGVLTFAKPALAWLDCPYGRINDPYPGQCELYINTNKNDICDRSELPGAVSPELEALNLKKLTLWASFLILSFYFIHWYLVNKTGLQEKFKWLNQRSFRYIWNVILVLSFIPTAVTGLLFFFEVRSITFSLWHYRTGIIFIIVAAIHLANRFKFFFRKSW